MKRKILILSLFISVLSIGLSASNPSVVLAGNSLTNFGEYVLTNGNYEVVNNVAYRTWELKYPDTDKSFTVLLIPGLNNNCCFVVRGDDFEIKYSKNENKFGACLVDHPMRNIRKRDLMKQIDASNLQQQEVITQNERTVEEYLGLIACFMPLLFG